jgi:hypothetical protein
MNSGAAEPAFLQRLGRFLRWFFNASPDAIVEPPLPRSATLRRPTVSHRQQPRPLARHSGPVRVAVKGKQ